MKKVIVTGANGFIGNALCKELASNGIEIIAIVRNEDENISNIIKLPGIRIVYCDLSEFSKLPLLIGDRDIDALYHLAWVGSAGPLRGDIDVQISNVKYTCDTVKVCSEINCKRMIFASSIMEYEIISLMQSDMSPGINTLYSSAKVSADYLARTIAAKYNIEYIRAVISNIYGPGELSPRLINTSLRKLLNNEHCSFTSGEQMYDFIYIDDAAREFIGIGINGINNRTYYIGSKEPRKLKDFLIEMKNQVNSDIEIGLGEIDFQGITLNYDEFDIHAVERDTGVVPEISFAEGIKRTIEWIKEDC